HPTDEHVRDAARRVERAHLARQPVVRQEALEPGVPKVELVRRLEGEVLYLVRMVDAHPILVVGREVQDVDVAVVTGRRDERVPGRARARRRPIEAEHLRAVVLEVAPRVAPLAAIAIAREVPVAEVERAERADALVLAAALVARHRWAVVPALGPVASEVA